MYTPDLTNPYTLLLLLVITVLLIFLGKETKKPFIPGIGLAGFIILVIMHSIQLALASKYNLSAEQVQLVMKSIGIDAMMIFITFFSYLWVDDIACQFYKKKNLDNSLDWFWNKV